MQLTTFLPALLATLAIAHPSSSMPADKPMAYCPSQPATPAMQEKIFHEFVQKFYIKKDAVLAFGDHMAEDYIQHNPNALSGRQSAVDFLVQLMPKVNITLMHVAFTNNTGYAHFRQDETGAKPAAIVDILRFEGTCVHEHWDVIQERPDNPVNPLAMWS